MFLRVLAISLCALYAACRAGEVQVQQGNTSSSHTSFQGFLGGATLMLDACSGQMAQESNVAQRLVGHAAWTVGKQGCAIALDGNDSAAELNQSIIDPGQSFTLAAWVTLDDSAKPACIVSQDGAVQSGFSLRYLGLDANNSALGMALVLTPQDASDAAQIVIKSTQAMPAHMWTHIAATFDATTHVATVYMNGKKAGQMTSAHAFMATGHTVLGRELDHGKAINFWPGKIDAVSLTSSAMSEDDVSELFLQAPAMTPVRAPAVPLAVRDPYLSTWSLDNNAQASWPAFWTGAAKSIAIMARVDDTTYQLMGVAADTNVKNAIQVLQETTPTQSKYVFSAGKTAVYLTFSAPFDANDLLWLSVPLVTLSIEAQSTDGDVHDVQLYADISAQWAHGATDAQAMWQRQTLSGPTPPLTCFSVSPASPNVLMEASDYASWGEAVWATAGRDVSYQSGPLTAVRSLFASTGALANTDDTQQPRAINNAMAVFGFARSLPKLGGAMSSPQIFVLGHVRQPSVSYLGSHLDPLWLTYWPAWQNMVVDVFEDAQSGAMQSRAESFDLLTHVRAVAAGGAHYAALCAVALRQALGGISWVKMGLDIWIFLKEISSDGNVSTVDVMYPASPAYLWVQPEILRFLLAPVLAYAESGAWPQAFAPHDLGASFPNATGHNDGGGENMPVEESANMVLMTAMYAKVANNSNAIAFVAQHYTILKKWTDYLVVNALDPNLQNQTDDFTGPIANSSNLALKGILAIGAMGQLATLVKNANDAALYTAKAQNYIGKWQTMSQDLTGPHLMLAYMDPNTWSLKYNALPDRILGLNLIPASVLTNEMTWYTREKNVFGVPLDYRHTYNKIDWALWTAGGINDTTGQRLFIDSAYDYINLTSTRVPLSDLYDTITGARVGFQARPVVGGLFSLMTLNASGVAK